MIDINDNLTDDITNRQQSIPEINPNNVDWDDKADVLNAADYLSQAVEQSLGEVANNLASDPLDGSAEALLLSVTALAAAADHIYETWAPLLTAKLEARHADWLPELAGVEYLERLEEVMPDLPAIRLALLKAHATGEPVEVELEDSGSTVMVEDDRFTLVDD